MKKATYSGKSKQDLIKALQERRETLRKLRFGSTGSKARNVKGTGSTRKDIARIMTELKRNSRPMTLAIPPRLVIKYKSSKPGRFQRKRVSSS